MGKSGDGDITRGMVNGIVGLGVDPTSNGAGEFVVGNGSLGIGEDLFKKLWAESNNTLPTRARTKEDVERDIKSAEIQLEGLKQELKLYNDDKTPRRKLIKRCK